MKKALIVLSAIVATMQACTHDPNPVIAGKGGSASVSVYPQHHTDATNLDSMTIYVKYNTLDAPANGVYDDSMNGVKANNLVSCIFSGLKNGKYYFFVRGYDQSIAQKVKGGLPYTITEQKAQNVNLPVGEE